MLLLTFIACFLVAGCSAGERDVFLKDNFFTDKYVVFSTEHDIVRIYAPLNQFNFDADQTAIPPQPSFTLFFVEGDYKNGEVFSKGLYIFTNGKVTKLIDNGRDAVTTQTNTTYLGAEDGIYKYDSATNTATKYGTVTDSVSQFAYDFKTGSIYYVTDENEVYKLNEDATASSKVEGLTDVQEISFDYEGSFYYYNSEKEFYVITVEDGDVPKRVTGLPDKLNNTVLSAPFRGSKLGVPLYVDRGVYSLQKDYSEKVPLTIEANVTACTWQPVLYHFYSKDKKLYAFNNREFFQYLRDQLT